MSHHITAEVDEIEREAIEAIEAEAAAICELKPHLREMLQQHKRHLLRQVVQSCELTRLQLYSTTIADDFR